MARRKQAPKDLTGIRQLGSTYQVRISGGIDPVTGRQLFLSSSADTQDAAIVLRDRGAGSLHQRRPLCPRGEWSFAELGRWGGDRGGPSPATSGVPHPAADHRRRVIEDRGPRSATA